MNNSYEHELGVAVEAVERAARLCRSVQSKIAPQTMQKKDRSPVTVADFGAQALVCRALRHAFPSDPVIGEEDASDLRGEQGSRLLPRIVEEVGVVLGQDDEATTDSVLGWIDHGGTSSFSDRFWTLDPIDGTKGFLRKEQYAVALALVVEGRVTVAALACPNLGRGDRTDARPGVVFTAVAGQGARVRGLHDGDGPVPIRVSDVREPVRMRFCESVESGHSAQGHSAQVAAALGISEPPVRLDSQAKYGVVARGDAQIYLRLPTRADYREKIWDHAAGSLIVAEAGGTVTDVRGKALDFTRGRELTENRGIIVSNGPIHDLILERISAVLAAES